MNFLKKYVKFFLDNNEICYSNKNDDDTVDFLAIGSYGILNELTRDLIAASTEDLGYKLKKII